MGKPILILGHARAGTTVLTGIINWHSKVGEKILGTVNEFLKPMSRWGTLNNHQVYSSKMEMKDFWFKYLPGQDVFTHMGREMIYEEHFSDRVKRNILTKLVDGSKKNQRLLLKSPSLSFAIEPIIDLFPDIKIIAIYREPLGCINSWRGIGTGKEEDLKRIVALCRRWTETIQYVEEKREKYGFQVTTYYDLIHDTNGTLQKIFNYCELDTEDYINDIKLEDKRYWYRTKMPHIIQHLILEKTAEGRRLLREIKTTNPMGW